LSPTPLVFKTGRESFQFIQLLNSLVVVIDTLSAIFGRFYIVAVAMEKLEVGEFIFSALGTGKNMVDFRRCWLRV
jgi:hypothetical protein